MANWEEKLEKLALAGARTPNVVMIGGVPTWTVVLFRRILELTGKSNMLEVWPKFQVYTHGGVSFTPYRHQFQSFFPSPAVDYQEIYNASEGFFAVQDKLDEEGLLLLLNNGIYYEFIPMSEWEQSNPKALSLAEVEVGKNYALVISTNSGLWRYLPGDTVIFTSVQPYRIKVSGRTKQFVNAFGEEVMVDNTDKALAEACLLSGAEVREYTVAPVYFQGNAQGGHQWIIEFVKEPADLQAFTRLLDLNLQRINSDYEAKRFRDLAMLPLSIQVVPNGTFHNWLRAKGKLGGQHKVPRLSNHRNFIEEILAQVGA
nr:GH3 auxin-responsive promoter family protein [Haliscomenobacter sp.]